MGNVHRFQGCLFPNPNEPTVQEIPAFSHSGSILQNSKLYGFICLNNCIRMHQYLDDGLVRATSHQTCLQVYPNLSGSVPGIRLGNKHLYIRAGTQAELRFHRLSVRPQRGQGQTDLETLADLKHEYSGASFSDRRMGNILRFQECLFPYPNEPTVQEISAFSHSESILQNSKLYCLVGQNKGIRIHQYLDDGLVRATSHQICSSIPKP